MSYNLIDQPFIPCLMPDGSAQELSLRQALCHAHEMRELRDASPLVTVALHRLLLAILHRNFGPRSLKQWKQLWEAKQFDAAALEAYFKRWHHRFDLFDPRHPFYQAADPRITDRSGINSLAQELARGENKTLFDHTTDEAPPGMVPAAAARFLIADQCYALGGGKSPLGNRTHGPLAGGISVLAQGPNLFQTLLLNLVVYNEEEPFAAGDDKPVWERDDAPAGGSSTPAGYLDLLTWQSRTILLHPETTADGVMVRQVSYAQGRAFAANGNACEPSMAYRRDAQAGDRPIRLSESRVLWRDSAALFQFAESEAFRGPRYLHWLGRLVAEGFLPRAQRYDLAAIGLCADQASVHFWRHERLPLPLAYLDSVDLIEALRTALELAEQCAEFLQSSVWAMASAALTPGDGKPGKDRIKGHVKERAKKMVKSLSAESLYWSRLEVPFRRLVIDLAEDAPPYQRPLASWAIEQLRPHAMKAFAETAGRLDSSSRMLRAVAAADAKLRHDLNQLTQPWKEKLHEQIAC